MERNISLFIAFRLLFNARFYYPVFAVIQLDYGLSMTQFALLNLIWAASIVLLEVPSGALADRFGRRRLVIGASVLMVLEMALIAFVPLGNASLVFAVWALNRILSGAAEAAASGADEALAYDSIPEESRLRRWPEVLSRLMMLSSLAFVVAMLVGAACYDPAFVNRVLQGFGSQLELDAQTVMRFPVYLTLASALVAVAVACSLREPQSAKTAPDATGSRPGPSAAPPAPSHLVGEVREAARWVARHPLVLSLLLAALVHDSMARLFLTSASQYYRIIGIPEAWFGVIGASLAAIGIVIPRIAKWLVACRSRRWNVSAVSAILFLGLCGAAFAVPFWGVATMLLIRTGMIFLQFFSSHYLNAEVDSRRRATVLSFKGLALNLGFGALSLAYAGLLLSLGGNGPDELDAVGEPPAGMAEPPGLEEPPSDPSQVAYRQSLPWLPVGFAGMLALYWWKWGRALKSD